MPVQKMIFWDLIQFHDMANLLKGHELHNLGRRLCGHYYYAFSFFPHIIIIIIIGIREDDFWKFALFTYLASPMRPGNDKEMNFTIKIFLSIEILYSKIVTIVFVVFPKKSKM